MSGFELLSLATDSVLAEVLLRMVCSIRFHRSPRFDGRVDYKMTLNNCSSLDLEAHLKGRRKYKINLRKSSEFKAGVHTKAV